jgi:hypothetical protein
LSLLFGTKAEQQAAQRDSSMATFLFAGRM